MYGNTSKKLSAICLASLNRRPLCLLIYLYPIPDDNQYTQISMFLSIAIFL